MMVEDIAVDRTKNGRLSLNFFYKMKLHKKGLMLKFLATVILTLIIFLPACAVVSKVLKVSSQSKESFTKFVDVLNKFAATGEQGEIKSELLILDEGTAAVYYEPEVSRMEIVTAGKTYSFNRPSNCELDQNCICLLREIEKQNTLLKPKRMLCYHLENPLVMSDCTPVGHEDLVVCSSGFFIARDVEDFKGYRRTSINLIKEGETVFLSK